MFETLTGLFRSEFFWGIVIGAVLTGAGSYLIVHLQESSQRRQRKELIRQFSLDTVENILQTIRSFQEIRDRTSVIYSDFLAVMEGELAIFGRNREHIIHLDPDLRGPLRTFINTVVIRRAEISNNLAEFYRHMANADQISAAGDGPRAEQVKKQAQDALTNAQTSANRLAQLAPEGEKIVAALKAWRPS